MSPARARPTPAHSNGSAVPGSVGLAGPGAAARCGHQPVSSSRRTPQLPGASWSTAHRLLTAVDRISFVPSAWAVGWSASGEGWPQAQVGQCPVAAGSGQPQAGALQLLLDDPQCLGEVLPAALGGPAEYPQAVFKLVEGEPCGRAGVQLAVFEVA